MSKAERVEFLAECRSKTGVGINGIYQHAGMPRVEGDRLALPFRDVLVLISKELEKLSLDSALPAFGSVAECPKCGEGRTRIGSGESTTHHPRPGFKYEYVPDTSGDPNAAGHMEIICPRCGHGWDELPKDATNA